jgi:hypothetical protein
VRVNGVVLQSSVLKYNAFCDVAISCAGFVPTYGAIGAYYNLDMPNRADADLPAFVTQMRAFTTSAYDPAIAQFLIARVAPGSGLLNQLSNTTVSASLANPFNLAPDFYQANRFRGY